MNAIPFRGLFLLASNLVRSGASNRYARRVPVLMGMAILAAILSGCASVKEGHDPIVVNAERTLSVAFESIDGFLRLEHQHREWTKANTPHVHAIAETIRKRAPDAFRKAHGAIKSYKRNRTLETRGEVGATVADVQRLGAQATSGLAQLNPPNL